MGLSLGGVLGDVGGFLFGEEDNSAQKATKKQNAAATDFIKEQLARSRNELLQGYPLASQTRNQGAQSIIDMLSGSAQQRYNPFVQGNMNAQGTIANSGQQFQNALMGLPVDYGFMQAQAPQAQTGWMNQQIPESPVGGLSSLFNPPAQQEQSSSAPQQGQQPDLSNFAHGMNLHKLISGLF